ncbi:hypothetical protein [Propionivibrio soli]|uniref:hypothetical protein n=1 Tax=Propionivibrio soli TaxID=2976531 RepID=UPI0021E73A6C|nr:hypothetical protein [Propionivibrio soli]
MEITVKPMKVTLALLLVSLAIATASAHAETLGAIPTDSKIIDIVTTAMRLTTEKIVTQAAKWLSFFMLAQYAITNYKLLLEGAEIHTAIAKTCGSVLWFAFCWYCMTEGPAFINAVGNQFFRDFAPSIPSPSTIILSSIGTSSALVILAAAVGVGSTIIGQAILYVVLAILGIGLFFALKLYLLMLELGITVMMAPFNFSFLGLNALKDNGIAPFKSLMTLMFRIVIYGILFGAFSEVGNAMALVAQKYTAGDMTSLKTVLSSGADLAEVLISGTVAYVVLFGLLFKSDAIAANLSSGSTSLGTGDISAAAAAGAAAASVVSGMATASTSPVEGMSDWIKREFGGIGLSDASDTGAGDHAPLATKPELPSLSLSETPEKSMARTNASPVPDAGEGSNGQRNSNLGYQGTPNPIAYEKQRDPERDAARKARREAKAMKAAKGGSIGGESAQAMPSNDLRERIGRLNHHLAQERATTQVSINMHHD